MALSGIDLGTANFLAGVSSGQSPERIARAHGEVLTRSIGD